MHLISWFLRYCTKAKQLLKSLNVKDMKVIELDTRGITFPLVSRTLLTFTLDDGSTLQQVLGSITGQTTVPSVWIGGRFIGGCDGMFGDNKNSRT